MADSDNSTTLPFVIQRRRKRRGAVHVARATSFSSSVVMAIHDDPALALWREWQEIHHATSLLCRLQQRQERRLSRLKALKVSGADDIRSVERDHEAARSAELEAIDAEEHLLAACTSTTATSLQGVLAKLEIIESAGQGRAAMSEFPWPQLRSAASDLRMALTNEQGAAMSA